MLRDAYQRDWEIPESKASDRKLDSFKMINSSCVAEGRSWQPNLWTGYSKNSVSLSPALPERDDARESLSSYSSHPCFQLNKELS